MSGVVKKATLLGIALGGVAARPVCDFSAEGATLRFRFPRQRKRRQVRVVGPNVVIVAGHVSLPSDGRGLVPLCSATTEDLSRAVKACGAPIVADYRAAGGAQ